MKFKLISYQQSRQYSEYIIVTTSYNLQEVSLIKQCHSLSMLSVDVTNTQKHALRDSLSITQSSY